MTEVKKKSRPNRPAVLWALGFIIALAALIAYDVLRQTVHLPAALRYVSTNASAIVFTRDLAATWDDLADHVRPIFKRPRAEDMKDLISDIKDGLAKACIAPASAAALNRYGIDPYRGAAVAFIGQLQPELSENDVLAVIPVTSELEFSQTLASIQLSGGEVVVAGARTGEEPIGFRLRRPPDAGTGKLCAHFDGQIMEIGQQPQTVAEADLYFVPFWFEPTRFSLECVALYENGQEGACTCELNAENFNADSDDCLESVSITPDNDVVDGFRAGTIDVEGLEQPALRGITIPDTEFKVIFTEDRWAIITDKDEVLVAALADPQRNHAYHRNSDSLRALSVSSSQMESHAAISSLAGYIRIPWLYSTSPVTVDLKVSPARLSLELDLDLPRGSIALFDRLTRAPGSDQLSEFVPYGAKVALALADGHLAYYLRYLFEYVDGAFDWTESTVGHLAAAIRALSETDSLEALTLMVPELREGVPEFALVAKLKDAEVAEQIILDLQRQLRTERDVEILEQAIDRYTLVNNEPLADLSTLYAPAEEPVNGEPYLVSESHDTWASYSIEADAVIALELPEDVFATDSYVVDTRITDATGETTAISLRYLLPPVTDNDFEYRYDDLREDETDQPVAEGEVLEVIGSDTASEERNALRAGENRLCAAYVRETGSLWIGSDAVVLNSVFQSGAHMIRSRQYATARELSGKRGTPKGALFAHTGWMLDQALAHPNDDIVELAEGLVDLSDYEQLLVTITAREDRNGLEARIELLK